MIVPQVLLRRHGATGQDRLACRAVGRRIWLPIEGEVGAMRFAMAFWDLIRVVLTILFVAPLIILGIVDRTLLGGPTRIGLAVVLGATLVAAVEYLITFLRLANLSETDASWTDGDGNQHVVRLGAPKPYDSLLSIATGVFAAAMMLAAT
jgi:hypothetical protein